MVVQLKVVLHEVEHPLKLTQLQPWEFDMDRFAQCHSFPAQIKEDKSVPVL